MGWEHFYLQQLRIKALLREHPNSVFEDPRVSLILMLAVLSSGFSPASCQVTYFLCVSASSSLERGQDWYLPRWEERQVAHGAVKCIHSLKDLGTAPG